MNNLDIIERIHSLGRFGSKLGLERMGELMRRLGNPQDEMKVVHIAGTNGKGSVCRYIYCILKENGYKVGLYTSPFLERFTERIEFDGKEISEEELTRYGKMVLDKVDEMTNEGLESPTEFEVVTAIGFCYFKSLNIDFLVLEVGLGGRGDSTNIIKNPIATAITSISFDHVEYLGNTLGDIAREKAGIIKKGVPMISNVKEAEAAEVISSMAAIKDSKFYGYPLAQISNIIKTLDYYEFDLELLKRIKISMLGSHQIENAICAIKVIKVIEKDGHVKIDDEKILEGLKSAKQTGRFEIMKKSPIVIIDGAHNDGGAISLLNVMEELFPNKKVLMVVGMLADKDLTSILKSFGRITNDFIATEPLHPRKLKAKLLEKEIKSMGYNCINSCKPEKALKIALDTASEYDVILVAGSLYLIGKIRGEIKNAI